MREKLITAWMAYADGNMKKHIANIEVYLKSPVGIGEHSDILESMEQEAEKAAYWKDQLEIIKDLK